MFAPRASIHRRCKIEALPIPKPSVANHAPNDEDDHGDEINVPSREDAQEKRARKVRAGKANVAVKSVVMAPRVDLSIKTNSHRNKSGFTCSNSKVAPAVYNLLKANKGKSFTNEEVSRFLFNYFNPDLRGKSEAQIKMGQATNSRRVRDALRVFGVFGIVKSFTQSDDVRGKFMISETLGIPDPVFMNKKLGALAEVEAETKKLEEEVVLKLKSTVGLLSIIVRYEKKKAAMALKKSIESIKCTPEEMEEKRQQLAVARILSQDRAPTPQDEAIRLLASLTPQMAEPVDEQALFDPDSVKDKGCAWDTIFVLNMDSSEPRICAKGQGYVYAKEGTARVGRIIELADQLTAAKHISETIGDVIRLNNNIFRGLVPHDLVQQISEFYKS